MRLGAVVVIMVLLGAAGCSTPAAPPPPPAQLAPDVVFFSSERGITVADSRGDVRSAEATVASADWSLLYAVRGDRLVTLGAAGDRELASAAVPAGLTARVVSTSGRLVALTRDVASRPVGRARTTIVVADAGGTLSPRSLELDGNFEPEAFSSDDAYLFVLEYLPANAPERYRVRRVALATGAMEPLLLRDKRVVPAGAEEEMRGEGRQAVLSPDRTRLYTLYLHQGDHQHTRDLIAGRRGADGRAVHAFVHVLSLTEGWAYCLDLPDPFGLHPPDTHALTISPDGNTLYVGELTSSQIAVADTANLTITKVVTLPDAAPSAGASMATSPDGRSLYLASANLVRRLDSTTLRVNNTWPQPAPVRGLAPTRDGRAIFVGHPDHVSRLDITTGQTLNTFPTQGLRTLHASKVL